MVSISFTQFRQNAKKYFDTVEKGERVRVLRHGKVIAEIVPPSPESLEWKQEAPQLSVPGVSFSRAVMAQREETAR